MRRASVLGAGPALGPDPAPPLPQPAPEHPWRARITLAALAALVAASFASLDLQWRALAAPDAAARMAEFVAGFFPPQGAAAFVARLGGAAAETVAMSAIGTLLAAAAGLALALPAALAPRGALHRVVRGATRLVLNTLRAVPELVWASVMVIAAGLGPLPGTLALAAHTTGVLGRLFAEAIENLPPGPVRALRDNGVPAAAAFLYATLPQALAQLVSYTLYRWENNIRAAAVLGVVGAGGLGQMLHYHLSLFQMRETASVLAAMLAIVALVDAASWLARRRLAS